MKNVIENLLDEFYDYRLPSLTRRSIPFPMLPRKATVIVGMRRTGKTWFCYQKIQDLLAGGMNLNRILYVNFDDDRLLGFTVKDFQSLLDVYYARFPDNKGDLCYFFFDEIQTIDHWEQFIRRLIDRENIQVTLTGSSSKLLGVEIATSLRGRTYECEMFPMSFGEYLAARGLFKKMPTRFPPSTQAKLRYAIKDYFTAGGFPETIHLGAFERHRLLRDYIDSVLFRDVIERYKIKNTTVLRRLIGEILRSSGQKFSVNKFYNTINSQGIACDKTSLYTYLDHLTDAFLFYRVELHHKSERVRRVNPPKIYTVDPGILYTAITGSEDNNGPVFENIVFNALRRYAKNVEYVRTQNGREVDFLVTDYQNHSQLVQASWSLANPSTREREIDSLIIAGEEMDIQDRVVVTWDEEKEMANGIRVLPVWKFLLETEKSAWRFL